MLRCRGPCVANRLFNSGNHNQHNHHDTRRTRHLNYHHTNPVTSISDIPYFNFLRIDFDLNDAVFFGSLSSTPKERSRTFVSSMAFLTRFKSRRFSLSVI